MCNHISFFQGNMRIDNGIRLALDQIIYLTVQIDDKVRPYYIMCAIQDSNSINMTRDIALIFVNKGEQCGGSSYVITVLFIPMCKRLCYESTYFGI